MDVLGIFWSNISVQNSMWLTATERHSEFYDIYIHIVFSQDVLKKKKFYSPKTCKD